MLNAVPSPELREGSPLILRCQTKLHPQKSASRLLFSFHRDASTLQDWGPHPELYLPGAQERDSGLYWCRATLEGGVAQKQSPQLEVRVQGEWGGRGDTPQGPGLWATGPVGLWGGIPRGGGARSLGGTAEPPLSVLPQFLCPSLYSP